ncbi:MAG: type III-A CRISPR-associated RAMP protein Csm3 [Thermovirgaceae bacterium]
MVSRKPMIGKAVITGDIICRTGLHIGGSDTELSIGGMDNPVIRDPLSRQPYVPGSSLKGKLRSLLERSLDKEFNKKGGPDIWRHECNDTACPVCRLFGASTEGRGGSNIPSRLQVRDAFLTENSLQRLAELDEGLPYTEWKSENSLDRVTCAAMPRPIERVPASSVFSFEIVYTIEDISQVKEDLDHLQALFGLLEDDSLGGGGSRGSGKVSLKIASVTLKPIETYISGEEPVAIDLNGQTLGTSLAGKLIPS